MSGTSLRVLVIAILVIVAFTAVLGSAYAQPASQAAATATATMSTTTGGAAGAAATATPRTLPTTGGTVSPANTVTVVLLALGATAGLGGLLLRGLRQPR